MRIISVFLSFDKFFRHACKCETIVKFVKITTVLEVVVQARSWRSGQYGHGRTSILGFPIINKGWPDLDFGVKSAAIRKILKNYIFAIL